MAPTKSFTPESLIETAAEIGQASADVGLDALRVITKISRQFLVENGYSNPEGVPSVRAQRFILIQQPKKDSVLQLGYIPIFLAASGYYVIVSLKPKSWMASLFKLYREWKTHLMWGVGYGTCACLAACTFPPYTKWLVFFLVGFKWCEVLLTLTQRSRRDGLYIEDESDIDEDDFYS